MMTVRVERKEKKKSTGNDDGESGNNRKKKITYEANNVVVVSGRRNTIKNPNVNASGSGRGKIPKALLPHLPAGPREEQGDRLINPGLCDITGCKVKTSIPLKCDTSYDSTMNYDDMCRNICHRDCAKEAGLISELDDTFLYCSQECKNKGDKYRNKELQNNTPKN